MLRTTTHKHEEVTIVLPIYMENLKAMYWFTKKQYISIDVVTKYLKLV